MVQTGARVLATVRTDKSYAELATEAHQRVGERFRERYGIPTPDWSDAESRRRFFPLFLAVQHEEAVRLVRENSRAFVRAVCSSFLKITVLPLPYAELCRFAEAQKLDAKEENLRATMTRALKGLVRGRLGEFSDAIQQVPACKWIGFGWNALYWLLTIPPALLGLYVMVRQRNWLGVLLVVGTVAYFAVTTALVQAGDGMQRYRLRLLPYLYCMAAVGWQWRELQCAPSSHPRP